MRYQAGFGRSELKGVGINTGKKLKDCGALELRSLGTGGVADPKIHAPPHMCYHVKFGSSATTHNGHKEKGTPTIVELQDPGRPIVVVA